MTENPNNTEYYRRLVDLVLSAGEILMTSGAETHRVEDTITRILKTTGFPHADAFVLTTGITVTLSDLGENTFSITRRIEPGATNMAKISEVNAISRAFCKGSITLEEAENRLKAAETLKVYSCFTQCIATMVATASFAFIFGGGVWESAAAAVCGLLIGAVLYYVSRIINRGIITVIIGASAVTLCALGLREAAELVGITIQCQYVIIGSIMPVVPGVAITNAIRDMLQGDYLASGSRMIDAFLSAAAVALGVGFGLFIGGKFGMTIDSLEFAVTSGKTIIRAGLEILLSFVAITGFCIIFEIPKKLTLLSASLAAVCWFTYLVGEQSGLSVPWASFFAAMVVYLFAFLFAKLRKAPVTLFLIGGILPLVPGTYIYKTAFYMITSQGDTIQALVLTILTAGLIALAVFIMDSFIGMIQKGLEAIRNKSGK